MKRAHAVALTHPPQPPAIHLPVCAAPPTTATTAPFRRPRLASRHRSPMASAASSPGAAYDTGSKVSTSERVGQNGLLIVGPGVLGRIVAEKWQQEHPGCKIFGQTASTDHHCELTEIGIIPSLKGLRIAQKVPYVIFCAPPYRTDDYPGDLRVAASNWNGEGSFLFTSSTAVYDCNDNGLCGEVLLIKVHIIPDQTCLPFADIFLLIWDSLCVPIGRSPRTDVLLKAEHVVLEAGGCVLRLAGLYKKDQGPHVFWLSKGTVDARPDHIINLIHYEDAASLAVAIMTKRLRGRVFVGCDDEPLSRQQIMDRVNRSGKFDTKFQGFTGCDGPLGKRMNNSKTRAEIGWQPKYPSFTEFLGINN